MFTRAAHESAPVIVTASGKWLMLRRDDFSADATTSAASAANGQGAANDNGTCNTEAPTIELGADEHRVNDAALGALTNDPDIYVRGQRLVRVVLPLVPPRK